MQARTKTWALTAGLACCLAAVSFSFGQALPQTPIPATPRELKFQPLQYAPPKAAAYRQVLNNGAVGFFVEDHDLPLVNVSILIRVGAYLDPSGKEGLASATANQLRSGGTTHLQADAFDEEADYLAASIQSGAGSTSGSASVSFMVKDTDKALALFFDMLRNPAFQQDQLDLYRSRVLQGMERRNDRTEEIEGREWNRLLRGEKHFTSTFSTKASVTSLTREDLLDFHRKYYHPGNFIFAVSGDFRTEELKAKLEKAMAGWTQSGVTVPEIPKPEFTPVPGVYMVNKPDVNQGRVSIGHLGIMRGNPDEYAIDMMNDILGGSGFTSRIMNRVRTDEGLAYDAGSSFTAGIYFDGEFVAAFQSKSATAAQAAQIVLNEIRQIREGRVSAEELQTVKNQAIEVFPRLFASASAIAQTFAADEFTGRTRDYWDTYRDKVKAVSIDDIQRVARKFLHPDKMVILAVGNIEDMLKGNPDRQEFSFQKIGNGKITRIPLPDPLTMVYPQ
jgi:zinc protease